MGVYTRSDIEPYLLPGVQITNGYEVLSVEYLTEGGAVAGGTFTLPVDWADPPPPEGAAVVVNAHGTIGLDDPCTLSGTSGGIGLAALFGGRGAIGVAPDYPGLGTPGFHRYLDARAEGTSVLDSARAALRLASLRGVPTNARVAVVGMSQGGHAALAAAALHETYAPELDLRAVGVAAPANVYEEQWRLGVAVPGEHIAQHAMLLWSFAEAAGIDRSGMWAAPVASTIDATLTSRCWWSPNFGAEPLLSEGFPTEPSDVFAPALLEAYTTGSWVGFTELADRFDANRIVPWSQTAPVAVWQGTADATVLPYMTAALVEDLRAGGVEVELHWVEGATHTTTAFGFLAVPEQATEASVEWVLGRL